MHVVAGFTKILSSESRRSRSEYSYEGEAFISSQAEFEIEKEDTRMVRKPLKAMSFVSALAAVTLLLVLPPVARKAIGQAETAPAPPALRARTPRPAPPATPAPPEPPESRDRQGWLGITLSEDE